MDITIRKLTPDLAEAYAHFFDVTPHDVNVDENKCYCVTWRSDDAYTGGNGHWFPTREERRARAIEYVQGSSLQGYLAYQGGEIVGWCNANADCQLALDYLRGFWPIPPFDAEVKVKSIFCFVIAPRAQRMGVATQLVRRVVEDAAAEGYDFVEAYVNEEFTETIHEFRGPMGLYEKCGFAIAEEKDGKVVMRKALK